MEKDDVVNEATAARNLSEENQGNLRGIQPDNYNLAGRVLHSHVFAKFLQITSNEQKGHALWGEGWLRFKPQEFFFFPIRNKVCEVHLYYLQPPESLHMQLLANKESMPKLCVSVTFLCPSVIFFLNVPSNLHESSDRLTSDNEEN